MTFGLCHFLCHQFIQRDEPDQIIAAMDALTALSAAFVRSPDINHLDQFMGRVWRLTVSTVNVLLCCLSVLGKQGKPLQVLQIAELCPDGCSVLGKQCTDPDPRQF